MNQRDPGVLRVPNDRRNCTNDKNAEQPVQARSFEFLPEPRSKSENEQDAYDFEGVDPSTQKSKADQQSSHGPVERKLRTLFNREPKREHCRHPKTYRQRVRRYDKRAHIENGCDIERDHGPKTDGFTKETPPEIKKEQTRAGGEDWAPKTDAEF